MGALAAKTSTARGISRLVLALVVSCSCSCSLSDNPPPVVGRAVAHDAYGSCFTGDPPRLAWPADGTEIFYVAVAKNATSQGPIEIHAAKADGSGTRVLAGQMGSTSYDLIAAPPDGSALYCALDTGAGVYQASPAQKLWFGTRDIGAVAASSDDVHVAGSWTGVSIYDASLGAILQPTLPAGFTWDLLDFSPAGDQLFVGSSGGAMGVILDLGGTLVGSLSLDIKQGAFTSVSWAPGGIRVLQAVTYNNGPNQIQNLTTGTVTSIDSRYGARCAAWSPDGTKVAFWDGVCPASGCDPTNSNIRSHLFVADTESGSETSIAEGTAIGYGQMVFSPDGTRIAYIFDNEDMYVSDVP